MRGTPVPCSFDLLLLARYWSDRPVTYHHTAPILYVYALHPALREVVDEGLEVRCAPPPAEDRRRCHAFGSGANIFRSDQDFADRIG